MGYYLDWLRLQPSSHLIILKWPSWFRHPDWRIAWALILPIIYFMLLNFCIYKMDYLLFIEGLLLMFGKLGLEVPSIFMGLGRLRMYKINITVLERFSLQLPQELWHHSLLTLCLLLKLGTKCLELIDGRAVF